MFHSNNYLPLVLWSLFIPASCIDYWQPEQIHLAFGQTSEELVVVWSTPNATVESIVEYGQVGLTNRAKGNATLFIDGGKLKREQRIHKVVMTNLKRNASYYYHCGSPQGWSDLFFFKTTPEGRNFEVRGVFYGDMGNVNAKSLAPLQEEVQNKPMYDLILHVGDFAYDMDTENGLIGDQFMRQIEPVAAYVPYMTCPGNHEQMYNFSNYKNRFRMPNDEDGRMFYSFNIGPVHFVSVNTEVYYFYSDYGKDQIVTQYNWLINDLEAAINDRANRPWIIMFGHRPMYCTSNDTDDCHNKEDRSRIGIEFHKKGQFEYGLEKLLSKYGIDIAIWAHEHSYERMWPMYDYKVHNGSYNTPYVNPKAPVHIISGSAGCQERGADFLPKPKWSAFRSNHYGYTRFKVFNGTHVHFEQISVDTEPPSVIDSYWVIKMTHETFEFH